MCLGTISVGLKKKPNKGGFEPRCVIELNTAKFFTPLSEIVPIKFADLYPEQELIKLILPQKTRLEGHQNGQMSMFQQSTVAYGRSF